MGMKGSDRLSFHPRRRAGLPAEESDTSTRIPAMNSWGRGRNLTGDGSAQPRWDIEGAEHR